MALFTDRRSGVVHDIGMNAPPTHDPAGGMVGWASTQDDVRKGLAAVIHPGVLPKPPDPHAFTPNIVSPAERRQMAPRGLGAPSRTAAWGEGSTPTSQTGVGRRPVARPMTGATGWGAAPMRVGASFQQPKPRTRRAL